MSDDVKLDPEWEREKLATQEAGRRPPPKPPRMIVGAVAAAILMIAAGIAIFLVVRHEPDKQEVSGAKVRIEVRAMPVMTISKDGKVMGKTPISLVVPKGTTPILLEGRWADKYYGATGKSMSVPKRKTQTVVPDHDMTVDFTRTPLTPTSAKPEPEPESK